MVLTCSRAAATLRTAGATYIAAAGMGTTLTPADSNQEQYQQNPHNDQNNEKPVCVDQNDIR